MAIYSPRVWWFAVALLLWAPHTHCREFTHEDIREAMLSLVHMIRMSEDKLDRHELREKVLGEQVKKMLTGLDKKHRALEPLKGMISRLDERLSNVETIFLQKEERDKTSQAKINDALESIQKALVSLTPPIAPPADMANNLSSTDDALNLRLDATDAKIDAVKKEIKTLNSGLSPESLRSICSGVVPDTNPLEKHISEAEKLLNKYELKLNEYNCTRQPDFVPLPESQADESWHSKMTEVMERQEGEVKKIQRSLSDAESIWKDLARQSDLFRYTNHTIQTVNNATETILINNEMAVAKIVSKLREMGDRLVATNEDVQRSLTQSYNKTESAYNDIARSYENLHTDVQLLSKSDQVILETADNVIATKKRFEYGVNQILMEVGELIKLHHKNMNKTVSGKLDHMQTEITTNQTTGLNEIGAKIVGEISKVWRQIAIMHQHIAYNSTKDLKKLSKFSEDYVNATLDQVKKEVTGITTRVDELSSNMNHALGEMLLKSHEFRQMPAGLNKTLDRTNNKATTAVPMIEDARPRTSQDPERRDNTINN